MIGAVPSPPVEFATDEARRVPGEQDVLPTCGDDDVGGGSGGGDDDNDDDGDRDGGSEDAVNGPWETVATFWDPPQAHVARLRLEHADLPCVLLDENLIATDWFFANAVGGIKLQVP